MARRVRRVEGLRWLGRAANQNYVEAQFALAVLLVQRRDNARATAIPKDKELEEWGIAATRSAATILFAANDANASDFVQAERWARQAAEAGSAGAQAILGFILKHGPEEIRNPDQAKHWYAKSATAGCPQGALGYALLLAAETPGEGRDKIIAAHLARAAAAGLPTALYLLGRMTERGIAVLQDKAAAAQLYRRAANKGNRDEQVHWGLALLAGRGVPANPTEGESWLRRAALGGDPEAAALVGNLYARHGRLPPNFAEARLWFRLAAETGHRTAARTMGLMSLHGTGTSRDPQEAARWFRIAGELGDRTAQIELGNLVFQNLAEPDDQLRTRKWFKQVSMSRLSDGPGGGF